jgi:serine/threonine-protein kinase Chk1
LLRGSIKKAAPIDRPKPIFAVKFIHKEYATRHGRVTPKQLNLEITLHSLLQTHPNIVQFFQCGEDPTWRWIAMELAEGGDLFDKIESDVGVGEDIAHLYFTQLISAVGYMHSKGVGHRDIKPENILLSAEGNLKIADFGLATLFQHNGVKKLCKTSCGSPPYTAPEVVNCDARMAKKLGTGYSGDLVDIWSCGVVLFVLLAGNTPWDEPLDSSYEFHEYVASNGKPDDELWQKLPVETLSLLRGMMRVEAEDRFSLADVQQHPWFTRKNQYLAPDGKLQNPVALATKMFENMKIDFSQDPMASQSQRSRRFADVMEVDSQDSTVEISSTQPEAPVHDIDFAEREIPLRVSATEGISASQPNNNTDAAMVSSSWDERLAEEPSMSQFSSTPAVPISRTQFARKFGDILPAFEPFTSFFSHWSLDALYPIVVGALHRLSVPVASTPQMTVAGSHGPTWIKIRTTDSRRCPLIGDVVIEPMQSNEGPINKVTFVKSKGDPLQWRRFFKDTTLLCQDAVLKRE